MTAAPRRFERYLEWPKLAIVLFGYAPYSFLLEPIRAMPTLDRMIVIAVGGYLFLSSLLRNLVVGERISAQGRIAWVAIDILIWIYGQKQVLWFGPGVYTGLMLVGDAAMVAWPFRRGLISWLAASLLVGFGPLLYGMPPDRKFWINYLLVLIPGFLFIYAFVYLAGRMGEEREQAQLARKEAELANVHLQEYASQVEELAVLRERNRLAREVHDTIAHGFTGIIMQMEAISRLMERDPARAAAAMAAVQEKARQSLNEVRRSVHALRPLELEERHGVQALQKLVDEYTATTGVTARLQVEGLPVELTTAQELCLYRAAQEGLTNAFRHGRAKRAQVRLQYGTGQVLLAVTDDGRGAKGPVVGGLGIVGIQERVAVLGGSVEARPGARGGFELQVTLPVQTSEGGAA